MSVFMVSSSIVCRPGPVNAAAVRRELREPRLAPGWSTVDYARSTATSSNAEMRAGIPRVLGAAVDPAFPRTRPQHTGVRARALGDQRPLEDLVGRRHRQPIGEPHVAWPRLR